MGMIYYIVLGFAEWCGNGLVPAVEALAVSLSARLLNDLSEFYKWKRILGLSLI